MATYNSINNASYPLEIDSDLSVTSLAFNGADTLNRYIAKTSWTPAVSFAGGTTGLSYTSSGSYEVIGDIVFFYFAITFSAKGTSTGQLRITIPYGTTTSHDCCCPIRVAGVTQSTSDWPILFKFNTSSYFLLYGCNLSGNTWNYVSDSNCANNSSFNANGFYIL
jgi:hypothetical protein